MKYICDAEQRSRSEKRRLCRFPRRKFEKKNSREKGCLAIAVLYNSDEEEKSPPNNLFQQGPFTAKRMFFLPFRTKNVCVCFCSLMFAQNEKKLQIVI